jgi:hypothetical protein
VLGLNDDQIKKICDVFEKGGTYLGPWINCSFCKSYCAWSIKHGGCNNQESDYNKLLSYLRNKFSVSEEKDGRSIYYYIGKEEIKNKIEELFKVEKVKIRVYRKLVICRRYYEIK